MDLNEKISKHFYLKEFFVTSASGGRAGLVRDFKLLPKAIQTKYLINLTNLAKRLDVIREHFDAAVTITSGWRSERVNNLVGGAAGSYHVKAMAADFNVKGKTPKEVQAWLDMTGFKGGVGYGSTFTHVDIRPSKARWNYGI